MSGCTAYALSDLELGRYEVNPAWLEREQNRRSFFGPSLARRVVLKGLPSRPCVDDLCRFSVFARQPPRLDSTALLDPFHVLVAETEMVADLVDQHVAHHIDEVFASLAPIVEDRSAIQKDHVHPSLRIADAFVR